MFTITIPIKPYVKRYLVMNYSEPANLSTDQQLNNYFRRLLKKPVFRHDKYYDNLLQGSDTYYSEKIEIIISESDFYRYGWELTKTNIVAFNGEIESRVKHFMRNTVHIYENLLSQKDAILRFQEEFGFTEDIWPYESIKKDYYRYMVPHRVNIKQEMEQLILKKINKKIMAMFFPKKDNITNKFTSS